MPGFLFRLNFSLKLLACSCLLIGLFSSYDIPKRPRSIVHKIREIRFNPCQSVVRATYCNPLNLDYGYPPFPEFSTVGRHRATADPVITLFEGRHYLFSTNQKGY